MNGILANTGQICAVRQYVSVMNSLDTNLVFVLDGVSHIRPRRNRRQVR